MDRPFQRQTGSSRQTFPPTNPMRKNWATGATSDVLHLQSLFAGKQRALHHDLGSGDIHCVCAHRYIYIYITGFLKWGYPQLSSISIGVSIINPPFQCGQWTPYIIMYLCLMCNQGVLTRITGYMSMIGSDKDIMRIFEDRTVWAVLKDAKTTILERLSVNHDNLLAGGFSTRCKT